MTWQEIDDALYDGIILVCHLEPVSRMYITGTTIVDQGGEEE